jgi:ketosteroid isomerase-like protein
MRKGVPAAALASICAAVLIVGRTSAAPADPSGDAAKAEVRKWIEKGNAEWVEGYKRADAAMVVAGFASDAVNERTRKYMETSGPAKTARADIADLVVSGNLAYEWGTSEARFAPKPGGPEKRAGRYLTCWKKQPDGSWKIFRNLSLEAEPGK